MLFKEKFDVETIVAEIRVEMDKQGFIQSLSDCWIEEINVDGEMIDKCVMGLNLSKNWELTILVYSDCKYIKGKFRETNMKSLGNDIRQVYANMHFMHPRVRQMKWNNNTKQHHQYLEKKIDIKQNRSQAITSLVQEAKWIIDNVLQ